MNTTQELISVTEDAIKLLKEEIEYKKTVLNTLIKEKENINK